VRHRTVLLILIGALGLGAPSFARDIHLPKTSVEALKGACEKAGGRFSQDKGGYGCATNCTGGVGSDCIVTCKAENKCIAQVIGGRRPHTVAEALTKPQRHAR
jgi:glycine cleavage system aminomethyltransferase T